MNTPCSWIEDSFVKTPVLPKSAYIFNLTPFIQQVFSNKMILNFIWKWKGPKKKKKAKQILRTDLKFLHYQQDSLWNHSLQIAWCWFNDEQTGETVVICSSSNWKQTHGDTQGQLLLGHVSLEAQPHGHVYILHSVSCICSDTISQGVVWI